MLQRFLCVSFMLAMMLFLAAPAGAAPVGIDSVLAPAKRVTQSPLNNNNNMGRRETTLRPNTKTPSGHNVTCAGCDPRVLDAMRKKSAVMVAYEVAATEEIMTKPSSVLAMTCFNQAAGVAAKLGGEIFSDDISAQLRPIIEPALQDFFQNFATGTIGGINMPVGLSHVFNCQEMSKLWDKVKDSGINRKVPYITGADLTKDTPPPGAGDDFKASWQASAQQGVFRDYKKAMDDLPKPNIPDFSGTKSSCDVLRVAGIVSACN